MALSVPSSEGCPPVPIPALATERGGSPRIIRHRFKDIDHFTEQIQSLSKLQMTQLSLDQLECDFWLAAFEQVQFLFIKSSCPISVLGEKPRDAIVFSCLLEPDGPCLVSHGRRVSHHTLAGFDPDLEAKFVFPSQVHYVALLINRGLLQHYLEIMDRPDLDQRFWASNYIYLPETIGEIKGYLQQVLRLISRQPSLLQRHQIKTLLIEDCIPLLINAIPPPTQDRLQPPAPISRSQLVKQAEDYMLAHLDQPITLKDLCQALHTSQRPLFYGFQELLGVSPMEYLKIQRLQRVHRSLQRTSDKNTTVMAIAHQFGFWSAGHFTRDYKTMFGERPSETLRGTVPHR